MSFVFGSNSASTGYNLTRSLRWRNSASAYLNRTPASATNRQTWTWSAWVKLTPYNPAVGGYDSWLLTTKFNGVAPTATTISINTNYKLVFASYDGSGGSPSLNLVTTQVFRDYSSWYHIVVVADTTQATAANRAKMYVNGVQVTSFTTATYPAQNYNTYVNNNDVTVLGALYYSGGAAYSYLQFLDSYMAEMNFIDGQALTPSSFGSTNALTGVWQPARYTGTYGTNGFYLPFTDNSALTTSSNVGLGKDFSGNANYWVTNNISITAGVTYDSMTDVPTLTSATAANYAVLNPLASTSTVTLTEGNLSFAGNNSAVGSMFLPSGTAYFEALFTGSPPTHGVGIGVISGNKTLPVPAGFPGAAANLWYVYNGGGATATFYSDTASANTTSGAIPVSGNTLQIAIDADAGKMWYGQNNTWYDSAGGVTGNPSTGANPTFTISSPSTRNGFTLFLYTFASGATFKANFGQRPFAYTPPTGFVALNTFNLPTSTIVKGNTVMDATLWTGTGATQNIVNAAPFRPDFVWIKIRSAVGSHRLLDSVRGATNALASNLTQAEFVDSTGLTAFNNNGFTLGADGSYNGSGSTYVGWQWQAGQGTTSSNTNGSITSTVSVNASAGFSVVTYSGNSTNSTVGHGLGVAPSMIFIKGRTNTSDWRVYHASVALPNVLNLNTTSAAGSDPAAFTSTSPTSSVFSIGSGAGVNSSGNTYVAYCWTPIAGYSAFGSYTGNGSTDGVFVYTGFQPKFVLLKNTNTSIYDWWIYDSIRNSYNQANLSLQPDLSSAETNNSNISIDTLSNGFKLRGTNSNINGSGNSYIYAAFATSPFKNSLAF